MSEHDQPSWVPSTMTLLILWAIRMGGRGEEAKALALLDAIIARTDNIFARQERALLYARLGEIDRARADWRFVQSIDPTRPSLETHLMVAKVINRRTRRGKKR